MNTDYTWTTIHVSLILCKWSHSEVTYQLCLVLKLDPYWEVYYCSSV